MKTSKYTRPNLTKFGSFREITLSGVGTLSDGGCYLGCNFTGEFECGQGGRS